MTHEEGGEGHVNLRFLLGSMYSSYSITGFLFSVILPTRESTLPGSPAIYYSSRLFFHCVCVCVCVGGGGRAGGHVFLGGFTSNWF